MGDESYRNKCSDKKLGERDN